MTESAQTMPQLVMITANEPIQLRQQSSTEPKVSPEEGYRLRARPLP